MLDRLVGVEAADTDGTLAAAEVAADEIRAAGEWLRGERTPGDAAVVAGSAADPAFVTAAARAVVARVLAECRDRPAGTQPAVVYDRALRRDLVDLVARTLDPTTSKGVGTWLAKKTGRFVSSRVTNYVVKRRSRTMDLADAALADILFYQRRGAEIRACVAESLAGLARPVVAVGHSLGGVILVDLLSQGAHPPVDLLVTVGSQAPIFYAVDALEALRPGGTVAPFTPWLNIYNREDLLSFCAERVFPGLAVEDVPVDAGVPFPESHSAYWRLDDVYREIAQRWPVALDAGRGEP
jgi:hypothetical protein